MMIIRRMGTGIWRWFDDNKGEKNEKKEQVRYFSIPLKGTCVYERLTI